MNHSFNALFIVLVKVLNFKIKINFNVLCTLLSMAVRFSQHFLNMMFFMYDMFFVNDVFKNSIIFKIKNFKFSKLQLQFKKIYLIFQIFLEVFISEMKCPGLILFPNRYAKIFTALLSKVKFVG